MLKNELCLIFSELIQNGISNNLLYVKSENILVILK